MPTPLLAGLLLGLLELPGLPGIGAALGSEAVAPTARPTGQPTDPPSGPARADVPTRPERKPRASLPAAKPRVQGEVPPALDAAKTPGGKHPPVVGTNRTGRGRGKPAHVSSLVGVARGLQEPPFVDRRRRTTRTRRPTDFGDTLRPGEHFRFDVTFAGNPAGLAEAEIVAIEADPRGGAPAGAPLIRIQGHARTSGVVSILATVTDDMTTHVDANTGAAVSSVNVLDYAGWAPRKYKHRVTEHAYEGRGQIRIVDSKDDVAHKSLKQVPLDTFDALSAMAWVRSLRLEPGESAKAHVMDGTTLLRLEIESKGQAKLASMPSIAIAMGLRPTDTRRIDGTITRVDRWDQPLPGKRVFKMRAWLSNDERRIPLVLESDMWVGAIRLELTAYDPPPDEKAGPVHGARSGAAASASP